MHGMDKIETETQNAWHFWEKSEIKLKERAWERVSMLCDTRVVFVLRHFSFVGVCIKPKRVVAGCQALNHNE